MSTEYDYDGYLCRDDSGHQYFVPVLAYRAFHQTLVAAEKADDYEAFEQQFGQYRLGSHIESYIIRIVGED